MLDGSVDVHQHLWPPALIDALRGLDRSGAVRLDGWTLHLPGEPPYEVDPAHHDLALRVAQEKGTATALVSLSSPLGIESLPGDEGAELLAAWHDGALALPAPFGAWAAASLAEVDPAALERELDRGFVGLQLPATTLVGVNVQATTLVQCDGGPPRAVLLASGSVATAVTAGTSGGVTVPMNAAPTGSLCP